MNTYTAARSDQDANNKVDVATKDFASSGGTISDAQGMRKLAEETLRINGGINCEALGNASPDDIKQLNKFFEVAMIARIFSYNLAEQQDARAAWVATSAFLSSGARNLNLGDAIRDGLDAVVDARKDSINMVQQTSAMEGKFIGMLEGQMRFERAGSPEYIESESIRAYLTQNRNEWFMNPDPYISLCQDVAQDILKTDASVGFKEGLSRAKSYRYSAEQLWKFVTGRIGLKKP